MSQIFSDQLEEVKTLISSTTNSSKSLGYSTLLHLQEQSTEDDSLIQILAANSQKLFGDIVADIADDDEEIAAQSLKCLGFMIYHPLLVDTLSVDDASLVLGSIAKLITNTQLKSICNLGVWCISIQQLNPSYLAGHFDSLLRAVVHALDNPTGSLSTTFEAMQALMKLASQIGETVRESSNIWAPPIYRRLLSIDKREKDMSERCLLKIKSFVFPPLPALAQTLGVDMKQKLLTGMKELLDLGKKVQTVQAWGWFIRLLGSHAKKDRHLVNDMLKILEQTFTDHDSQVQIASLVAWEGLIDGLIQPIMACKRSAAVPVGNSIQQEGMSKGNNSELLASGFVKSLKLIMTPLIGIMSSKCDISVHSSCLNTWCFLLHKLDITINFPSVIEVVLEPIFEAVFQNGPDALNIGPWPLCIDLLDDFIIAKCGVVNCISDSKLSVNSSIKTSTTLGPPKSGKCAWKRYPIKWLPWDLPLLEFHMKAVYMLINQAVATAVTHESRRVAYEASIRIFRSVLRGVRLELKSSTTSYDDIMWCLNTVLGFTKKICEAVTSEGSDHSDLYPISLQFIEAITEELEPFILGSPLYKVAIDLKYIGSPSVDNSMHAELLGISYFTYMDMVSPVVYLIVLYFSVAAQSTPSAHKMELILQGMHKYFKFVLSSYDPLEIVLAVISLLYKHVGVSYLKMWMVISKCLNDCIGHAEDFSLSIESDSAGYFSISCFLAYPFDVCSFPRKELSLAISRSLEEPPASQKELLYLEHVTEVWKSLYVSLARRFKCSTMNSFRENMSSMLNGCIDNMLESGSEHDIGYTDSNADIISLSGNILICVLESLNSVVCSSDNERQGDAGHNTSSDINNTLAFASRSLKLFSTKLGTDPPPTDLTSRVFSALTHFASCLRFNQDILLFYKEISNPIVEWLTCTPVEDQSINSQLQRLWDETLQCLQRSEPPIAFDSAFLALQAPHLEKTLNHQDPTISNPTISFWNHTYGKQTNLDYPRSLLDALGKLSRNGRINICKRQLPLPFLAKCNSRPENVTARDLQSYRVTSMLNRASKRVELINGDTDKSDKAVPLKRKRSELTEHQKEVRRAQQGRSRDCSGHGPGIRTYTSVDFSQGNEDSQDSEEMQNLEAVLEMLGRES